MTRKKNKYLIITLIVLLLGLGVAYAALGGALIINGTAKTGTFEVAFTKTDTGGISTDGQTLTVGDIVLDHPGDSKTINATVENLGTLGATINSFNIAKTGATTDQDAVSITVSPSTAFNLNAGNEQAVAVTVTWVSGSKSSLTGAVGFTLTANYSQNI